MKKFIFLLAFISIEVKAQTLTAHENKRQVLKVDFIKAMPADLDSFELTSRHRQKMILACARNIMFANKKAFLRYKNYYNLDAGDFDFDNNNVCLKLQDFLYQTFEGVSEEAPLVFYLDLKKQKVKHIFLPNLDPYEDGSGVELSSSKLN